jgi:hypothetical protein
LKKQSRTLSCSRRLIGIVHVPTRAFMHKRAPFSSSIPGGARTSTKGGDPKDISSNQFPSLVSKYFATSNEYFPSPEEFCFFFLSLSLFADFYQFLLAKRMSHTFASSSEFEPIWVQQLLTSSGRGKGNKFLVINLQNIRNIYPFPPIL